VDEVGAGRGEGFTLNVPLPPGSGSGAYRSAFDRVVEPALDAFRPQLILVSAGWAQPGVCAGRVEVWYASVLVCVHVPLKG
jgi:hypothetical protein